jgi:hypothetical protein
VNPKCERWFTFVDVKRVINLEIRSLVQ